jgi:hypothetical protein
MRNLALLVAAVLCTIAPAFPQISPNDRLGLGTKRGIQQMHQSGQVGTVMLLDRGPQTSVDVSMHGVPAGKIESVAVVRNSDCTEALPVTPAYPLNDLVGGHSRTIVNATNAKLLSGNYSVVVRSQQQPEHALACGHLFR